MSDNQENKKRRFVRIPQTKATVARNLLLAAGLVLIALGIVLLIFYTFSAEGSFPYIPCFFLIAGLVMIFLVFGVSRSSILLGCGILSAAWGVISLISDTHIVPFTKGQLWPIEGMIAGAAIFISGFYHFRKVRSFYLFPAIAFFLINAFFMFFSIHIIKVSFASFIGRWWPVLCIAVGVAMVVIFLIQQKNHKIFPYMEDDSTDAAYGASSDGDIN